MIHDLVSLGSQAGARQLLKVAHIVTTESDEKSLLGLVNHLPHDWDKETSDGPHLSGDLDLESESSSLPPSLLSFTDNGALCASDSDCSSESSDSPLLLLLFEDNGTSCMSEPDCMLHNDNDITISHCSADEQKPIIFVNNPKDKTCELWAFPIHAHGVRWGPPMFLDHNPMELTAGVKGVVSVGKPKHSVGMPMVSKMHPQLRQLLQLWPSCSKTFRLTFSESSVGAATCSNPENCSGNVDVLPQPAQALLSRT